MKFLSNAVSEFFQLKIVSATSFSCFQFSILNEVKDAAVGFNAVNFNAVTIHDDLSEVSVKNQAKLYSVQLRLSQDSQVL